MFCRGYFLLSFSFNGPLEDRLGLSQNVMDRLSPNFQDMYIYGGHDQYDLLFSIAQETLIW